MAPPEQEECHVGNGQWRENRPLTLRHSCRHSGVEAVGHGEEEEGDDRSSNALEGHLAEEVEEHLQEDDDEKKRQGMQVKAWFLRRSLVQSLHCRHDFKGIRRRACGNWAVIAENSELKERTQPSTGVYARKAEEHMQAKRMRWCSG